MHQFLTTKAFYLSLYIKYIYLSVPHNQPVYINSAVSGPSDQTSGQYYSRSLFMAAKRVWFL